MFGTALKISLMLAVTLVGMPHAFCAGHPSMAGAMVHHDRAVPVCENCTGGAGRPESRHSHPGECPHCGVHGQPYVPSGEVKLADTTHSFTDWVLLSVPLLAGEVSAVAPADFWGSAPIGHVSGSGCALTILLGRLLL